jgi:large subunit ribosomal protein L18
MIKRFNANQARLKRHRRMRSRLEGSHDRPRLNIYRSGMHIYAQIIDDTTGQTLAAASSLDEALRNFMLEMKAAPAADSKKGALPEETSVEMAAEVAPAKGKGARTEKAPAKGAQPQKGTSGKGGKPFTQVKTQLPSAVKGVKKTPVEALAAIADNRKVAIAREVGKLVAQRAREKGVSRVVFDRGGYAYHGRVAALAEGARETGLSF